MNRKILLLFALTTALRAAAFPGWAAAAVVTGDGGLPPVKPIIHLSNDSHAPSAQNATAKGGSDTVPAIAGGKALAGSKALAGGKATVGGTSANAAAQPPSPAQVWKQAIATPPEGAESPATAALARQALAASQGADATLPVFGGSDGAVNSLSGRPVLVCSPLHTCVIELPNGVKPVTTAGISKAEWLVQQAMVGDQPEIFLMPKFAGLHQNIVIAATRQGKPVNYGVRLVSDAIRYVPFLKINGNGGLIRSWGSGDSPTTPSRARPRAWGGGDSPMPPAKAPRVLPLPNVHLDHVNVHWSIRCGGGGWFSASDCRPIRPLRVFDDGTHTYIKMPTGLGSHGGFPILQARNASGQLIGVDTQIRGNTYVVDSVPTEIQLRLGSELVTIRKKSR